MPIPTPTAPDFYREYMHVDLGTYVIDGQMIRVVGCLHKSWYDEDRWLCVLKERYPILDPKPPIGIVGQMTSITGIYGPRGSWLNSDLCIPGMQVIGPEEADNKVHEDTSDPRCLMATMINQHVPIYLVELNPHTWYELCLGSQPVAEALRAVLIWMLMAYLMLSRKPITKLTPRAWMDALGILYSKQEEPWSQTSEDKKSIVKAADREVARHGLGSQFAKLLNDSLIKNRDQQEPYQTYNTPYLTERYKSLLTYQQFYLLSENTPKETIVLKHITEGF